MPKLFGPHRKGEGEKKKLTNSFQLPLSAGKVTLPSFSLEAIHPAGQSPISRTPSENKNWGCRWGTGARRERPCARPPRGPEHFPAGPGDHKARLGRTFGLAGQAAASLRAPRGEEGGSPGRNPRRNNGVGNFPPRSLGTPSPGEPRARPKFTPALPPPPAIPKHTRAPERGAPPHPQKV